MPPRVQFRNPYPIPDVSTEGFWLPPGPVLGKKVAFNDRRWKSKLETHERLFAHHTLNSIRKDQRFVRTEEPDDALDLALTSVYVHNEDTLVPKMYVTMQPESLGRETWRVLRNEVKTSSPEFGIRIVSGETSCGESGQEFEEGACEQERGSAGIKMARSAAKMAVAKMAARESEVARRAVTAPAGSPFQRFGARQLDKYAARMGHDGIPDRTERIHPSSLKLAFQGPHTDKTNSGYSRKEDGTFYGS